VKIAKTRTARWGDDFFTVTSDRGLRKTCKAGPHDEQRPGSRAETAGFVTVSAGSITLKKQREVPGEAQACNRAVFGPVTLRLNKPESGHYNRPQPQGLIGKL